MSITRSFPEAVMLILSRFLLAYFHLHSLIGARSTEHVRSLLRNLATEYGQLYDATMNRVTAQVKHQSDLGIQALQWILCAERPLTALELQHALAIDPGNARMYKDNRPKQSEILDDEDIWEEEDMVEEDEKFDENDVLNEDNISDLQDIISACAGLVTLDHEKKIICFVHYTAQKYLEQTQDRWFPNAQANITLSCVTYLSFDVFNVFNVFNSVFWTNDKKRFETFMETFMEKHRFFDYSAQNWGKHARKVGTMNQELSDVATRFLSSKAKIELSARHLSSIDTFPDSYLLREDNNWTGLHLAAYFDTQDIAKLLFDTDKFDPDQQDGRGWTPLLVAAWAGHDAVADLLIKTGKVDVNHQNKIGCTALAVAAEYGRDSVVKLLLDNGKVDVNSMDEYDRTPLWIAALVGHELIVKMLLDSNRAKLDIQESESGLTPFAAAVTAGHLAIVKMLLATDGVDANARDELDYTPLHHAAMLPKCDVLLELIKSKKVDHFPRNRYGHTPILLAMERRQEENAAILGAIRAMATGRSNDFSDD